MDIGNIDIFAFIQLDVISKKISILLHATIVEKRKNINNYYYCYKNFEKKNR